MQYHIILQHHLHHQVPVSHISVLVCFGCSLNFIQNPYIHLQIGWYFMPSLKIVCLLFLHKSYILCVFFNVGILTG